MRGTFKYQIEWQMKHHKNGHSAFCWGPSQAECRWLRIL